MNSSEARTNGTKNIYDDSIKKEIKEERSKKITKILHKKTEIISKNMSKFVELVCFMYASARKMQINPC